MPMANESTVPGQAAPAQHPVPESRMVAAGRGISWWVEGWRLFTPNVGTWLLIALILVVLALITTALERQLPFVGELLGLIAEILWPVVIGGLMLGCRAVDRGNALLIAHLFAGFSQRTRALVTVGAIYAGLLLVIIVVIGGMMLAIFGAEIFSVLSETANA